MPRPAVTTPLPSRALSALMLCLVAGLSPATAPDPAALRQTYAESAGRLRDSPFRRPLALDSYDADGSSVGSVQALVDRPFDDVRPVLSDPARWCELLVLMPNIASCRPAGTAAQQKLAVGLVRKVDAAPDSAIAVEFAFERRQSAEGLGVQMNADRGPLGTRDYRIGLAAIPADAGHSFLQLHYSYRYGSSARLASQAYFATSGRSKTGFTIVGRDARGTPLYIDGLRGAVERNAMRCYLAIDAILGSSGEAAPGRFEQALQRWIDAARQYPQLSEDDFAVYAAAKRRAHPGR